MTHELDINQFLKIHVQFMGIRVKASPSFLAIFIVFAMIPVYHLYQFLTLSRYELPDKDFARRHQFAVVVLVVGKDETDIVQIV